MWFIWKVQKRHAANWEGSFKVIRSRLILLSGGHGDVICMPVIYVLLFSCDLYRLTMLIWINEWNWKTLISWAAIAMSYALSMELILALLRGSWCQGHEFNSSCGRNSFQLHLFSKIIILRLSCVHTNLLYSVEKRTKWAFWQCQKLAYLIYIL